MSEKNLVVYKVGVNGFDFEFSQEEVEALDIVQKSPSAFHLLKDNKSVNATLIDADRSAKTQAIEIEGERFEIQIKDELDQVLDKMGFSTAAGKQIKEIKAPMPGLVLEIAVSVGQQVNEGDKILILVAMKMENSIIINTSATIKRIGVIAGDAVEKGQVLVELE
jgi:biotin carboxyl carrier protein